MAKLIISKSSSKLSIVGTPIGNIGDISLRAVQTLYAADIIACEDTRRAKHLIDLIKSHEVWINLLKLEDNPWPKHQKLISNFIGNEHHRIAVFMESLQQGKHIALISDSGMPALYDPGNILIQQALEAGYNVEIIPSASAYTSALIRAGLGDRRHLFLGFLPKYSLMKFEKVFAVWMQYWQLDEDLLLICYESPYRIKKTLNFLKSLEQQGGPKLRVHVIRELTKKHEQLISGSVQDALDNIIEKGEMVLIIGLK